MTTDVTSTTLVEGGAVLVGGIYVVEVGAVIIDVDGSNVVVWTSDELVVGIKLDVVGMDDVVGVLDDVLNDVVVTIDDVVSVCGCN